MDLSLEGERQRNGTGGEFWNPNEERFYGQSDRSSATIRSNGSGGRWKYPANFDDTLEEPARKKSSKKKKDKKNRWERTEDAYSIGEAGSTSKRKKSKKRKPTVDGETYSRRSSSTSEFPEDPEGGLYGSERPGAAPVEPAARTETDDIFSHEF